MDRIPFWFGFGRAAAFMSLLFACLFVLFVGAFGVLLFFVR